VGMTRARDRLMLSGGQLTKPIGESFLGFLQDVADGEVGNPEHDTVKIGGAAIRQTVVTSKDVSPLQRREPSLEFDTAGRKEGSPFSLESDRAREMAWQQANKDMAFLTPSSLQPSLAPPVSRVRRQRSKIGSQYVGTLVHQLLEQWDFQLDQENFRGPLREFCWETVSDDIGDDEKNAVVWDIEELIATFLQSSSYRELQQATVIGREIPFVMPWLYGEQVGVRAQPRVMEGVMDVVYEVAGDVWVGDYKTDRVTGSNVVGYAEVYRQQAQVYAQAAAMSLGLDIKGCKLVFLRIGETVTVMRDVATIL